MSRYSEYSLALTELILFIHSFTYISMCAYRTCVWARVCVPPCMLVEAGAQLCEGGSHLLSYVGSRDWIQDIRLCSEHLYLWSYHKRFLLWRPHLCVYVHMCTHTCRYIWRSEVRGQPHVSLFRCCPSIPHKALTGLELAKTVKLAS